MDTLFQPYRLNDTLTLANRFMMAPLTRCMAGPGLVPTEQMAAYYGRRADIGLIISEATIIRPDGQGYPNTPGLYSAEQVEGWKKVTAAVHARGGKIFAQLWHVGRLSHPFFHHAEVLAPSAVAHEGTVPRMRELVYQVPRALTESEIAQLVEDYAQAAANAIEAGFDGVEIHGANGYLIDQFLHHASNLRTDNYGGSLENRMRLLLTVAERLRAIVPDELPLFTRISATDWVEGGWDIEQSVILSKELKARGVDAIDVSSGGLVPKARIPVGKGVCGTAVATGWRTDPRSIEPLSRPDVSCGPGSWTTWTTGSGAGGGTSLPHAPWAPGSSISSSSTGVSER